MKKTIKLLKKYRIELILGPLLKLIEAIIELYIPIQLAELINNINNVSWIMLKNRAIFLLLLIIIALIIAVIAQKMAANTSQGYGRDLRKELFSVVQKLELQSIQKLGQASLVNRIILDVTQLETAIAMWIRLVVRVPFLCIGSFLMIATLQREMSIFLLIIVLSLFSICALVGKVASKYYDKSQNKLDLLSIKVRENFTNIKTVRSLGKEQKEIDIFEKINQENQKQYSCANLLAGFLSPITTLFINATTILFLYYGNQEILLGNMEQGDLIAIVQYLSQILVAIVLLTNLIGIYTKAYASLKRISEVFMEHVPENIGVEDKWEDSNIAIKIKNVSFSYYEETEKPLLNSINLEVKKGEIIGITGMSSTGKSTLLNLINGTYKAQKGSILLFNKEIKHYKKDFLKREVRKISQKPFFFSDNIENNILLGNKSKKQELEQALKSAQAYKFVEQKGQKVILKNQANFLSGGQKQRLALARAFIGKPSILLLDDVTSALDSKTEKEIWRAFYEIVRKNKQTAIIISQKPNPFFGVDKIFKLKEGKLVQQGGHK